MTTQQQQTTAITTIITTVAIGTRTPPTVTKATTIATITTMNPNQYNDGDNHT